MKYTHSFSIDFIIRRCKDNNNEALNYARITVDEERKDISLKEPITATKVPLKNNPGPPGKSI